MKEYFKFLFITLGVIFFGILVYGAYFAYSNDINPVTLFSAASMPASPRAEENGTQATDATGATGATGAQTNLSASQEAALRAVGIDPAVLTSLSETQKTCIYAAVGQERAAEIIGGATPTVVEIFKAKGCL